MSSPNLTMDEYAARLARMNRDEIVRAWRHWQGLRNSPVWSTEFSGEVAADMLAKAELLRASYEALK